MQLITIVAILFAIVGVLFALQNTAPVTVDFMVWSFDSSLALVLLLALALGGMIVSLVSTPATIRRQWTILRQQSRIEELEKSSRALEEKVLLLEQSRRSDEEGEFVEVDRPYVGLKQIIAGSPESPAEKANSEVKSS
jgi:uncharacterized integral membrane protein